MKPRSEITNESYSETNTIEHYMHQAWYMLLAIICGGLAAIVAVGALSFVILIVKSLVTTLMMKGPQ